jgi:hypothetical protein
MSKQQKKAKLRQTLAVENLKKSYKLPDDFRVDTLDKFDFAKIPEDTKQIMVFDQTGKVHKHFARNEEGKFELVELE